MEINKQTSYIANNQINQNDKFLMISNKNEDLINFLDNKKIKPINYFEITFSPQEMAEGDHREVYVFHDDTIGIIDFHNLNMSIQKNVNNFYDIDVKKLTRELKKDNNIKSSKFKFK